MLSGFNRFLLTDTEMPVPILVIVKQSMFLYHICSKMIAFFNEIIISLGLHIIKIPKIIANYSIWGMELPQLK